MKGNKFIRMILIILAPFSIQSADCYNIEIPPDCTIFLIGEETWNGSRHTDLDTDKSYMRPYLRAEPSLYNLVGIPEKIVGDPRFSKLRNPCVFLVIFGTTEYVEFLSRITFLIPSMFPILVDIPKHEFNDSRGDNVNSFISDMVSKLPKGLQPPIFFWFEDELYIPCKMCSSKDNFKEVATSGENKIGMEHILQQESILNGQGHGGTLYISYMIPTEAMHALNPECTSEYSPKFLKPRYCVMSHYYYNKLCQQLNLTLAVTGDDVPDKNLRGSHIMLGIYTKPWNYMQYPSLIYKQYSGQMLGYYCVKEGESLAGQSWNSFIQPLDQYIWLGMALSALILSILYRKLEVFPKVALFFLSQGSIKGRNFLLGLVCLMMFMISTFYCSQFATSRIVQLPEQKYSTDRQLLDAGYKIIAPSKFILFLIPTLLEKYTEEDFEEKENYNFLGFFENFDTLMEMKGIGLTTKDFVKGSMQLSSTPRAMVFGGVTIFLTAPMYNFAGYTSVSWDLSGAIFKLINTWSTTGVSRRMGLLNALDQFSWVIRSIKEKYGFEKYFPADRAKPINLVWDCNLVFVIYLLSVSACCLAFIGEVLHRKVIFTKWKRSRNAESIKIKVKQSNPPKY